MSAPLVYRKANAPERRIATLERQLAEAQAQMGAMRSVLEPAYRLLAAYIMGDETNDHAADINMPELMVAIPEALAPEAGKELLARLEKQQAVLLDIAAAAHEEFNGGDKMDPYRIDEAIAQVVTGRKSEPGE